MVSLAAPPPAGLLNRPNPPAINAATMAQAPRIAAAIIPHRFKFFRTALAYRNRGKTTSPPARLPAVACRLAEAGQDRLVDRASRKRGWTVVRIWEHELSKAKSGRCLKPIVKQPRRFAIEKGLDNGDAIVYTERGLGSLILGEMGKQGGPITKYVKLQNEANVFGVLYVLD